MGKNLGWLFSGISLVIFSQMPSRVERFVSAIFATVYQPVLLCPVRSPGQELLLVLVGLRAVTGRVSSQAAEMIRRNFPLCNQLLCREYFVCSYALPTTTSSRAVPSRS